MSSLRSWLLLMAAANAVAAFAAEELIAISTEQAKRGGIVTAALTDMKATGGVADGATVDAEGCYWVTIPFKGRVNRYDPAGKLMQTVWMPTDLPTCCEFGGTNLDILYVTTAVLKRPAEHFKDQRHPGGLFALDVGVKGLPLPAFAG